MKKKEENDIKKELKEIKSLLKQLLLELSEDYYPDEEIEMDELIQKRTGYKVFLA